MKYLSKIAFAIILSLTFFACNNNEQSTEPNLIDNSENISNLISSFDLTFKESISNPSLNDDELGNLFIDNARKKGLNIVELDKSTSAKSNTEESIFSSEYLAYSSEIQNANNFSTKEEFKNSLINLNNVVLNSSISIEEKQILVDNIGFMIAFVDWMETIDASNPNAPSSIAKSGCKGWWKCWGKCVAGTIGGAITGGISGCGVLGGIGAAVGSIIPGGGTAAGAIIGCAAGGIIGAIGGGLTGAAKYC